MKTPVQVLLVEDDALMLQELVHVIAAEASLALFATATSVASARILLDGGFDVLVVDKGLPDGSGIDLIRELKTMGCDHKFSIMLTVFDDRASVLEAIQAGADGYLLKHDPNLAAAIEAVVHSGNPISSEVVAHLVARVRDLDSELDTKLDRKVKKYSLSVREQATLQGLAEGLKYQQIAERLEISPHTVTDYIKSIYRKLSVNSRSSAVFVGLRSGLVDINEVG